MIVDANHRWWRICAADVDRVLAQVDVDQPHELVDAVKKMFETVVEYRQPAANILSLVVAFA